MKSFTHVALCASVLISTSAFAQNYGYSDRDMERYNRPDPYSTQQSYQDHTQSFVDYAKVLSVTPEFSNIRDPRQVCNNEIVREQVPTHQERNYGGVAIGGIAGALIGNQVGGGSGRTAATAIGAVTGAMVGDNVANRNNYQPPQYQDRTIERCQTLDNYRREQTGYLVKYEYRGKISTIHTSNSPVGNKLRMNVQATPEIN